VIGNTSCAITWTFLQFSWSKKSKGGRAASV